MQAVVSFQNLRYRAGMVEAQINVLGTHPAVKEKYPRPWIFRRSQSGGRA